MSREIKFRIWDGKKKEWLGSSDDDVLIYYGFHLVGEVMTVQAPPQWALDDGMVVEQYIGLEDNNGKEIYEGDILANSVMRATVYWDEEEAAFKMETHPWHDLWTFNLNDTSTIEDRWDVIGNIHENPELLKGEEE